MTAGPSGSCYAPGTGWCLARPRLWVLAGALVGVEEILRVSGAVGGDWAPGSLLAMLPDREAPGGSDWAIALVDGDELRLLLRGSVVAVVGRPAGSQEIRGSALAPWSEHTVPSDWEQLLVRLDGEPSDCGPAIPLANGIARGSGWQLYPTDAHAVPGRDSHSEAQDAAVPRDMEPAVGTGESLSHHTLDWARAEQGRALLEEPILNGAPQVPVLGAQADDEMHHLIFGRTENRAVGDAAGTVDDEPPKRVQSPEPTAGPPAPPARPRVANVDTGPSRTEPVQPRPDASAGLIDSFWGTDEIDASDARLLPPSSSVRASAPDAEPVTAVASPVTAADPRSVDNPPAPDDDIDRTVSRPRPHRVPAVDSLSVQVLSTDCPTGHPNPPTASTCRTCGALVPDQEPVRRVRPPLGNLRLSTDQVVVLDRDVLLGRKPSVPDTEGPRPHVVQVGSDAPDVSRTHLQIRLDEWEVLATDLSSNGTLLELPGREPEQLHSRQPHPLVPGSKLWLGDSIWALYEVTQ